VTHNFPRFLQSDPRGYSGINKKERPETGRYNSFEGCKDAFG